MKQNRVDAVLKNLGDMGLSQMLITDPLSIFYLTGRMIQPFERFYGLYLNQKGGHKIFINLLETVPEDLGVEKVRFSDTDPYLDLVAAAVMMSRAMRSSSRRGTPGRTAASAASLACRTTS